MVRASPGRARGDSCVTVELRPGVDFPNWSVVTSERARQALHAIIEAIGIEARLSGYGEAEDRVRKAVLDLYARLGHAPGVTEVAHSTGMAPGRVRALLGKLERRDLIVLEKGTTVGAYPFTERETGHRVHLGDRVLNAMCAIDALGVSAMHQTDVAIESACRQCGAAIRVTTRDHGGALDAVSPPGTLVWSGLHYADGCAATSLCTVLAFFCSAAHLSSWRKANPDARGLALTVEEGMQVGKAIFVDLLTPASRVV